MFRSQLSALCIASVLAGAAIAAQSTTTLTDKDRAEIQDLVAKYQVALNTCASKDYAALFTPDGVFASDDFRGKKHREMYGPNGGKLVGRAKIAELVETEEFCIDKSQLKGRPNRPAPTVAITQTAAGVTGTIPLGNGGSYNDVYVKTSEGWRFKSRTVTMPPAQQSAASAAGKPMTLGPMDIFEIQQLVARYAKAIDTCANNATTTPTSSPRTASSPRRTRTAPSSARARAATGWPRCRAAGSEAARTSAGSRTDGATST